jgi:hypothetical protein
MLVLRRVDWSPCNPGSSGAPEFDILVTRFLPLLVSSLVVDVLFKQPFCSFFLRKKLQNDRPIPWKSRLDRSCLAQP